MKKLSLLILTAGIMLASCGGTATQDADAGTANEPGVQAAAAKPRKPQANGPVRILFAGNSHTEYYVSLPELMAALCKESGTQVEIDKLVEMGVDIKEVLAANKDEAARHFGATDEDGNYYDYIIIQEKTPVALQEPDRYLANCKALVDMAARNSPGAAVYVYQLMSPVPYKGNEAEFKEYQQSLNEHALEVAQALPNAGVYRLGEAVADAYLGKNGYVSQPGSEDLLRHGTQSLHMLNDAGYLASVLLYQTIFDTAPHVPARLPLASGTGDGDAAKLQSVSVISNVEALNKIANTYK